EIRRDFVAQLLVLDLVADMATRLQFTDFQDPGIADKAQYSGFQHPVNALTERVQSLRYFAKQHPLQRANLPVRLGHDPRRRALVQIQMRSIFGDLGYELDGRGAGTDHRHPLAPE